MLVILGIEKGEDEIKMQKMKWSTANPLRRLIEKVQSNFKQTTTEKSERGMSFYQLNH